MTKAVLVLALVAVSFINIYQASDSPNYGTFFAMRGGYARTDLSSDHTQNIINEIFHKCSNGKSCSKVAENVKTKIYKTVAVGQEFLLEKQNARIWNRGKTRPGGGGNLLQALWFGLPSQVTGCFRYLTLIIGNVPCLFSRLQDCLVKFA